MNVDLTEDLWPTQRELLDAASRAGEEGTITIAASTARYFASLRDENEQADALRHLAYDLLKGVVLQGAARAAIPIPEDVRALVRLARELDSELKTPTPWPVEKPVEEEED